MSVLSKNARFILDRMKEARRYDVAELCAFVPGAGAEGLREVMHELWINRQVERDGDSGWRRHRSAPGQQTPEDARPVARDADAVKPEDLFDHDTFEEFFR